MVDDKIARGKEKYGGIISVERPRHCAPDAPSRCGMQLIQSQQCCIECVFLLEKPLKYKWASDHLEFECTPDRGVINSE